MAALQQPSGEQREGVFVLSLDTEIAWGSFDNGGLTRYNSHFNGIRSTMRKLVSLLDTYHIPATWAFVGHLLLDHCEKSPGGLAHPEVLRPRYSWYPHDWHHCDPGTDVHCDPWWYGPDLLQMVRDANTPHEIGTHTFSHVVVGDPDCTADILHSQLEACSKLHQSLGLEIHSIVYPRNQIAFLDVLPEHGLSVYRGSARRLYEGAHPRLTKLFRNLDRWLATTPSTYSLPGLVEGKLTNIPASMFYMPRDGFRKAIPIGSRVRQAKRGLDRAAQTGELFHLWFHPFNLGSDHRLFRGLEAIFQHAAALQAAGKLSILTMQDAALMAQQSVGATHTPSTKKLV